MDNCITVTYVQLVQAVQPLAWKLLMGAVTLDISVRLGLLLVLLLVTIRFVRRCMGRVLLGTNVVSIRLTPTLVEMVIS
jgi:hypothetical protein